MLHNYIRGKIEAIFLLLLKQVTRTRTEIRTHKRLNEKRSPPFFWGGEGGSLSDGTNHVQIFGGKSTNGIKERESTSVPHPACGSKLLLSKSGGRWLGAGRGGGTLLLRSD